MTRLKHLEDALPKDPNPSGVEDLLFLAIPVATYKALSDAAAKKNLTVAQAFKVAIENFLKE